MSDPVVDREESIELERGNFPPNVPQEEMIYRSMDGTILTFSLIAKGQGAGQYMSPAPRISDHEAEQWLDDIGNTEHPTEFEIHLKKELTAALDSRWL